MCSPELRAWWTRCRARGWTSESMGDALWPEMFCSRRGKQPAGVRFRECMSPEKERHLSHDDLVRACALTDDWGPLIDPLLANGFQPPQRKPASVRRADLYAEMRAMEKRHAAEFADVRARLDALPADDELVEAARFARVTELRVVGHR